jgi:hypothetical protein
MRGGRSVFKGLRPPAPPEELRERVLRAARGASPAETPSLVDRLWESGRLRLAAVVLYAVLVALDFGVHAGRRAGGVLESPSTEARLRQIEGIPLPESEQTVREQWREIARELDLRRPPARDERSHG